MQPDINLLTSASFSILKVVFTLSGVWNLDFFRYLIPPFCVSDQISPLHVIALEYIVAFYPLLLTVIVYICIQSQKFPRNHSNAIRKDYVAS